MKKVIFYLSSCSTCKRIMDELGVDDSWEQREIKSEAISIKEIEQMNELHGGSYEDLFSKRAMKYRSLGLNQKELKDDEFKQLITEEYTFLKRPVIIIDDSIFVGNSKKVVAQAKKKLTS